MFEEIRRIISIQNIFHRIGNWDRADLNLHPRDLSSHLVFEPCRRYVLALNMEGARHCLANLRKPILARHLRDARIKRGLSVSEVAEQVGVSESSIYFWETDHCRPREANLSALCKVLKLPVKATREMAAA